MTTVLLKTLNDFIGRKFRELEAIEYLDTLDAAFSSESIGPQDWQFHVPMHLLDRWHEMSHDERAAIYVMAISATRPYECENVPDPACLN